MKQGSAYLTTRAKLQRRISTHSSPFDINTRSSKHANSKRHLRIPSTLGERDVDPRFCTMTSSDEDDILHPIDSQAKILSKYKPPIDILDYPLSESASSYRILTLSRDRK